jgi:hypothetical protein
MNQRKKLERSSLRKLGLPKALIDEALEVDALGLDLPAPTDELVSIALERCKEELNKFQPRKAADTETSFSFGELYTQSQASFIGTLTACVSEHAIPFARSHPKEPAVLIVDNHSVIDPECWNSDPFLKMLQGTLRTAGDALAMVGGEVDRLIILKDDYDQRDLAVIREAIVHPTTRRTYVLPAREAGTFQHRGCTVIAKRVVFEMKKGLREHAVVVHKSFGVEDPKLAAMVYDEVLELKRKALSIYQTNGELIPKLKTAIADTSNKPLIDILKSTNSRDLVEG